MNIKNWLRNDEIIEITLMVISAISLIIGFIKPHLLFFDSSWIAIILCGLPIIKEATKALIHEKDIKADLLVSIAIISSIIIGEVFAAGAIALIMTIGGFLEEYTVSKTQNEIKNLIDITPQTATLINCNGDEEEVNAQNIKINDIIKVLPGEVIPGDGVIIKGESSINQAVLTGESLPADKTVGDEVYSGTINLYGSIIIKATKNGENNSINKLIKLIKSSKPENAKIVKTADKWATWIVVVAFICSIGTWIITHEILRAVTILIVFCPCALILATPTAIMAAIGNLTKQGILVKDGESLEELGKVNDLILDKTGTLTYGEPEVSQIILYNKKNSKKEIIHILASLENKSEHPLAKAIVKYYKIRKNPPLKEVNDFEIIPGKGVRGKIGNDEIIAGNKKILNENYEEFEKTKVQPHLDTGATTIYLCINNQLIGAVLLSDFLRNNAVDVILNLKSINVTPVLMSGDNQNTTQTIASKVGIDDYKYNCLPEDKRNYIKELQLKNNKVAMIGDGLNDAPSLKQANVGISMGSIGSDISIEASNITLIHDNIQDLPHLFKISKKTLRTINVGIGFALTLNLIATILAMLGLLNPIEGAFVHNIGSIIVIIYASSLLKYNQ
ncbi:cation-translocating P-type ATPase [uncultured Methanobrevibacter sp.]|uniref:heavy metal translocating P-type ATPase n=1 Tax=uncultured Methanobrevibacter sp. TaxID=253161 RepID=UPI002603FF29|nr:cation-translocating P-type ATPase [uncultured Methanobrevibacter sp.]